MATSLRAQFGNDFASSAFKRIDGEQNICGKFGRIAQFPDGSLDCWFVYPNLLPLPPRKLAFIRKNCRQEDGFTELTGEAYTQGTGRDFVLRMAALAGVKKKRRVTPSMRAGVQRMRNAANA